MSVDAVEDLDKLLSLDPEERVIALAAYARRVVAGDNGLEAAHQTQLVAALLELVDAGEGTRQERLDIGHALGVLGDPRILRPSDPAYWVDSEDGGIKIGRFMVTNAEFREWVDAGGYDDEAAWSEDGRRWKEGEADTWPIRARQGASKPYLVANQPVVGVTWYEAEAYARAHDARLPRFDERLWVVRGTEKRPYPWGSPFGEGNANTREEVLGRPCAVGLYVRDRTPDGVCDLAGNVAEWMIDGIGTERWIHPGAWDQPSMAAWAKARSLEAPESRWAGLGFRLARD